MTNKNADRTEKMSPLQDAQYLLRIIAFILSEGRDLAPDVRAFIAKAFQRIGEGEDANIVLGVKAKRGQRKSVKSSMDAFALELELRWIASAICSPEEEGLGLTLEEAILRRSSGEGRSRHSGYTYESLRKAWYDRPEFHGRIFQLPKTAQYVDDLWKKVGAA
jgi:hypothetical protein